MALDTGLIADWLAYFYATDSLAAPLEAVQGQTVSGLVVYVIPPATLDSRQAQSASVVTLRSITATLASSQAQYAQGSQGVFATIASSQAQSTSAVCRRKMKGTLRFGANIGGGKTAYSGRLQGIAA